MVNSFAGLVGTHRDRGEHGQGLVGKRNVGGVRKYYYGTRKAIGLRSEKREDGMMSDLIERLAKLKVGYEDEMREDPFFRGTIEEAIEALRLPEDAVMVRQVEMLRKQCDWQRVQGTKLDNNYPYHKHLPDCDICRSAELIDKLQSQLAEAKERIGELNDYNKNMIDNYQSEIESLQAQIAEYDREWEAYAKFVADSGWFNIADEMEMRLTRIRQMGEGG